MDGKKSDANKRGRPVKEKEKLSCSINLKLTEGDYKALKEKAESIGMKVTRYARHMALNGYMKSRYTQEELKLRQNLIGMGKNLNQLAAKANSVGFFSVRDDLKKLYDRINSMLDDR